MSLQTKGKALNVGFSKLAKVSSEIHFFHVSRFLVVMEALAILKCFSY